MPTSDAQAKQAVIDLLSDISPDEIMSKAYCHVQDMFDVASAYVIEPEQLDAFAYQEQMQFLKLYGVNTAQDLVQLISKCKHPSMFACTQNLLIQRAALRVRDSL